MRGYQLSIWSFGEMGAINRQGMFSRQEAGKKQSKKSRNRASSRRRFRLCKSSDLFGGNGHVNRSAFAGDEQDKRFAARRIESGFDIGDRVNGPSIDLKDHIAA